MYCMCCHRPSRDSVRSGPVKQSSSTNLLPNRPMQPSFGPDDRLCAVSHMVYCTFPDVPRSIPIAGAARARPRAPRQANPECRSE